MKKKLFDFNSAKVLDAQDELSVYRNNFNIPQFNKQDAIYFTGNSLGLQLKNYDTYLKQEMEDWKTMGVEGHFDAKTGRKNRTIFDFTQTFSQNGIIFLQYHLGYLEICDAPNKEV